jgi:hypothetical protein
LINRPNPKPFSFSPLLLNSSSGLLESINWVSRNTNIIEKIAYVGRCTNFYKKLFKMLYFFDPAFVVVYWLWVIKNNTIFSASIMKNILWVPFWKRHKSLLIFRPFGAQRPQMMMSDNDFVKKTLHKQTFILCIKFIAKFNYWI